MQLKSFDKVQEVHKVTWVILTDERNGELMKDLGAVSVNITLE